MDKPTPGNALMNLRYRDESAARMTGKEGKEFQKCFILIGSLSFM